MNACCYVCGTEKPPLYTLRSANMGVSCEIVLCATCSDLTAVMKQIEDYRRGVGELTKTLLLTLPKFRGE